MENKKVEIPEYGYITGEMELKPDTGQVTMTFDFGEYAEEVDYDEERMENELEFMWDDITELVENEGYDLGNKVSGAWTGDSTLEETYKIKTKTKNKL